MSVNLGGSNRMLSAADTAAMLGINEKTLRRNHRAWGLRAYRIAGRVKFRERDVNVWIEKQAA